MLLALAHQIQAEADDEQPLHFCHRLKKCFRMRRMRKITRRALMDPFSSAFIKLYNSQCTENYYSKGGAREPVTDSQISISKV
jgi:hypothetical protein